MTADLVLAIDQGTGSTRAIAWDADWTAVAQASRPLESTHPQPGWAEQDPLAILASVVDAVDEVLAAVGGPDRIAAVGLDNQGETVVAWDKLSGEPLAPAVLWNCRRSQPIVDRVAAAGHGPAIRERTGLPLDPYFSASKIRWLMEHVDAVAAADRDGRLAVGTVDAWLTARLGGPARTDPSTASRTQLFGLRSLAWDGDLAGWWGVPSAALPIVGPTVGDLGRLAHPGWGGGLPLRAMACDQQAALAGQGGHRPGAVKATFGTGVFVLANAGSVVPAPVDGLLTTIAWTDPAGRPTYALDGGVFSAGALLGWLADGIGVLDAATDLDAVAGAVDDAGGVRVLPALGGLGAPWWEPRARAVFAGLTASRLLGQRLADLLGRPLDVAAAAESTALGIGLLAAIGAGRLDEAGAADVAATDRRVEPVLDEATRREQRAAWRAFVPRAVALEAISEPAVADDPPSTPRRTTG